MKSPGSWFLSVLTAVLVPATTAAGIPVEGRVLAPDGRGMAGARVELWAVLRVHEQGLLELGAQEENRPAAQTATDAEGWYRLQAPREGMWRVAIAAPGFVPVETVPMALVEESSLQAVLMKADDGLLVRVEGADGMPVAGARVAAETGSRDPWTPGWQPVRRAGVSGADGTVRLPRSADETLEVGAVAPGHAPGRLAEAGRGSLVIRLQPGQRWQIEVRDPAGPVADAMVRDVPSRLPLGRTDSEGRLSVVAPASGPWVLRVDTRDGRMVPFQTAAKEGAEPGSPVTRRLHLPPLVQLTGRAVDRSDGRALPGALVWPAGDPAAFVHADGAGRYRLPWISSVSTWIQAVRSGYFYTQERYEPSEKASRDAPILALHPAGSLAGTTVDERGQPVPSAEVRVFPAGDPETVLGTVRSSAGGRFRMPNLRRGESYELLAVRPGLAPARELVTLDGGAEDPSGLRLVLGRGRTALGRVVDEDEEPVAGAEATLVRSLGAEVRAEGSLNVAVDDGLYRAETDGDGHFEIAGLPAGWFDLEVRRPGSCLSSAPEWSWERRPRRTSGPSPYGAAPRWRGGSSIRWAGRSRKPRSG